MRRRLPEDQRPYRMWLYPLPTLVALAGWLFVFATSDWTAILFGLGMLLLGILFFFAWSFLTGRWPFAPAEEPPHSAGESDGLTTERT